MITDFRLAAFFYPCRILRHRAFLRRTEHWTRERLVDHQERRLARLVAYAYDHVPYYRELFDVHGVRPSEIRRVRDLRRVPPLTKQTVRARAADLKSDRFARLKPRLVRTSGSTGTPLEFYSDRQVAIEKFATFWRVWGWAGYRLGQRWAIISGPVFEDGSSWRYLRPMNALYVSSFGLTRENADRVLQELLTFRPRMLRGYPSALCAFARLVTDRGRLRAIGMRSIVTNSETLLEFQREWLQDAFGCRVYDTYSSWEQVCVISECEHQSLHHQMEYGILELLDEHGDPVAEGEQGEIVATSLANQAMPLIRYRTGDMARVTGGRCECGRPHDVVADIDGRIEDVVLTPDGRRVGRMDAAFKYSRGFDRAQIVQDQPDRMVVRLVKNEAFGEDEQQMLEKHIRDRVGAQLAIKFDFVDDIQPDRNGKLRFVINTMIHKRPAVPVADAAPGSALGARS